LLPRGDRMDNEFDNGMLALRAITD